MFNLITGADDITRDFRHLSIDYNGFSFYICLIVTVQMMLLWFPYTVLLCGHVSSKLFPSKLFPDYNVKLQSRYAELSSLDLVATLSEYELYILLKKDEDFVIFYLAIPVTHFS